MKRLVSVALWMAVGCLALPALVSAQPAGGDTTRPGRGNRGPGARGGMVNPTDALKAALAKVADLTEEQKTKTEEILKKAADASKALQDKMTELRKQLTEAQTAKDDAKVTQLREDMRKLFTGVGEATKKVREDIRAVLTAEQNTKLDQLLAEAQRVRSRLVGDIAIVNAEKLKLTADQKTKIEELVKAYRDAASKVEGEGQERMKQMRELSDKLTTDVKALLTDEQKTELDKIVAAGRGNRGPGAGNRGNRGNRGGTTTPPAGGTTPPAGT